MPEPELALAVVGFGNVARRLLRLLDERSGRLDFQWRLVALSTRYHGSVVDPDGIDARRAVAMMESARSLDRLDPAPRDRSGVEVVHEVTSTLADEAAAGRVVIVESTVLDIERGEPAVTHARAALDGRAHVITVNKGPAAFAYHELATRAHAMQRQFLFEGAVMDGIPVFNLVRGSMPTVSIDGFRGILNTTCQYTLCEMERGVGFDEAIAEMQARGTAEADPSHDVDGWDAAAKAAALVNVLMDGRITPHDVARTGIREVAAVDLAHASDRGRRIRLVASATRRGGQLDVRVEPELLAAGDPLATLGPEENALYLRTDVLGEVGIVQRSSSLTQTAFALLSDLLTIRRALD